MFNLISDFLIDYKMVFLISQIRQFFKNNSILK
jgi:hypothetical protein